MHANWNCVGCIAWDDDTTFDRLVESAADPLGEPRVEEAVVLAANIAQLRADLWAHWQAVQAIPTEDVGSRRARR